jgi:hypothetical protein
MMLLLFTLLLIFVKREFEFNCTVVANEHGLKTIFRNAMHGKAVKRIFSFNSFNWSSFVWNELM